MTSFTIIVSFISGVGFAVFGLMLFSRYAWKKYQPTGNEIADIMDRFVGDDERG
jgi:hypothetical protein